MALPLAATAHAIAAKDLQDRNRQQQQAENVKVLLAGLKACSRTRNLEQGKQVHAKAVESGNDSSIYVASALINMYAKCGSMVAARQVFDGMKHPNVVSWSALIQGYAEKGEGHTALNLFTRMRIGGPAPNSVTFVAALKACTGLAVKEGGGEWTECGKAIHNLAVENGWSSEMYVQSTLIDMYCKCGSMAHARRVFDGTTHADVVSWNAMILGYAVNGQGLTALDLFTRMRSQGPAPDSATFVAALKACTSLAVSEGASGSAECRARGKAIHDLVVESGCRSNMYVQSSLIDMYAKCRSMADASQVFDSVKHPDVVSWNALILGYVDSGQGLTALDMFTRMKAEGPAPDLVTFAGALKACALLGALELGTAIHREIDRGRNLDNVLLVNCLVDFYAKCGSLEEARKVFDSRPRTRNLITWTSLLAGYSRLGDSTAAFGLFDAMQDAGIRPDGVSVLCILACCSHAGLVDKGKEFFEAMATKYGITPTVEHYNSMIDMFGRSNRLDDAVALLERMNCSPNEVTWMTILGACRKWKNVEIGRVAFESLLRSCSRDSSSFVLMEQIYGSRGMLQEQEMVVRMRRKLEARKSPGEACWANEAGEVHTFVLDDGGHPQIREIRDKWEEMRQRAHLPGLSGASADVECGHSERLALACALINTEAGKAVRIVKNVGVCGDCHTAIAVISKLECRSIFCRDARRMHVFKDGECSCGDSW